MVSEPTCNPDPDINQRVREVVEQRKAEAADDPLGDILGGSSVDEDAIRNSLESSRENCRNKWDRFKIVEEKVTPAVIAFRNIEGGVAKVVSTLGDYKRLLLCLLVMICAITATLARHHISLRPSRTKKDHVVTTTAQLIANASLLMSATVYRAEEVEAIASGVTVSNFYLHQFWIAGFALLTAASIYQLIRPP